jgi:alginate O-acetyltransferase complex protein AlgI
LGADFRIQTNAGCAMLFNSLTFLCFLPTVFVLYWLLPQKSPRPQNILLIIAGWVFYGWWDYRFLALLWISSGVDYIAGRLLEGEERERRRKWIVAVSMTTNLGILATFKYFNFFADSFAALINRFGLHADPVTLRIVLPVGISFYTFQSMAYTIDVYRRRLKPTRDPIEYFAFVSFFPQMVAGPIERAGNLLSQFQRRRHLDLHEVRVGAEQMLWGFFKKVVIADNLSGPVAMIFDHPAKYDSVTLLCGAVLFGLQIYCDFSGYSDIAIGVARFFDIKLTRNFAFPYFSRNIVAFWHRWHISLSTWFRDYFYIPLGGNRVSTPRMYLNLLATFAISGLWHGAKWTFVAWGLLHGIAYVSYVAVFGRPHERREDRRFFPKIDNLGGMLATFSLVTIAWIFFRAGSFASARSYLGFLFSRWSGGYPREVPIEGLILCSVVLIAEWIQRDRQHALELGNWSAAVRWPVYYAVVGAILFKGNFNYVPFIYFNF